MADDFSEYVLIGVGMSTWWRLCGKMSKFYVMAKCIWIFLFSVFISPSFSPFLLVFLLSPSHPLFFIDLLLVGVGKRVDFLNVLTKKWVGSISFREVDVIDRMLPSLTFWNDVFIS